MSATALSALQRWGFAIVPAVGLVELVAHVAQTRPAANEGDWAAARAWVAASAKPEDLVAFAPKWIDPVGRMRFGDDIANIEREARPDETRFPRAIEVGIRGAHLAAFDGWRKSDTQRFGGVTVTTWENPSPAHVLSDLVSMIEPRHAHVFRGDAECPWSHTRPESGGLGYGPAVPADRFACPGGGFAGMSVVADLDYVPHRCIYAPPAGGPLRIRFEGVRFGHELHGHHAIYVEAERNRTGAPVTLSFASGGTSIGSIVHRDGDGWKPFELDTSQLDGQTGELTVEVSSPSSDRRQYCFEADTR
ncbi:MAG TPA: hypothetical protein VMI75_19605 [Polyangiaceae bacterium]|nr:hypothetical protein [Polyangiaceae bacterium]